MQAGDESVDATSDMGSVLDSVVYAGRDTGDQGAGVIHGFQSGWNECGPRQQAKGAVQVELQRALGSTSFR